MQEINAWSQWCNWVLTVGVQVEGGMDGVQMIKINCVYFVCKEATGSKDSMILANSENSQVLS